ncbi:hypothetical protein LJK88_09510 [Paenibacillus sp. P26]|nr:hypothetical protein LJK88_09510 [Paenibacillus sp. P26]UUZ89890.1 hypothetical protein LJK87_28110 [Paenibacillus sp. P25]
MRPVARSKTLSVAIERRPEEVYEYVLNLAHFPEWATSFCRSIRESEDGWWVIETPDGSMQIKFVERNAHGVLDHYARLESGQEVFNPMRVIANGSGSEMLFTLFQLPGMSDAKFSEDAGMVEQDLLTLKSVLERKNEK